MAGKGLVGANNRPRCMPPATLLADFDRAHTIAGGIDIVDVDRLELAIRRTGSGFVDRVIRPDEREFLATDSPSIDMRQFAILFGTKESAVKVLGGLPARATLRDIAVTALPGADPTELTLHGTVRDWAVHKRIRMFAGAATISDRVLLTWVIATSTRNPRFSGASL